MTFLTRSGLLASEELGEGVMKLKLFACYFGGGLLGSLAVGQLFNKIGLKNLGQSSQNLQMLLEKGLSGRRKEQKHGFNFQMRAGRVFYPLRQNSQRGLKAVQLFQTRMRNAQPRIQRGADAFLALEHLGQYFGGVQVLLCAAHGLRQPLYYLRLGRFPRHTEDALGG